MKVVLTLALLFILRVTARPPRSKGLCLHSGPLTCNGKEVKLPDNYNQTMKHCQEVVFNRSNVSGSKLQNSIFDQKHRNCLVTCLLQDLELMDDTGKLLEDQIETFVKDSLPKVEATALNIEIKSCIEESGNKTEIPEECGSIERILNCTRTAFNTICNLEMLDGTVKLKPTCKHQG